MRFILVTALVCLTAPMVSAQTKSVDCPTQAKLVMAAVDARASGAKLRIARRGLRDGLGKKAGDMVADWIYSLPKEHLTDEIGKVWKAQCDAL